MAKVQKIENTAGQYLFYCPGCGSHHGIWTANEGYKHPIWAFNGDVDKPTVSPSILVTYRHPEGHTNENPAPIGYSGPYVNDICHSFIKDGNIQYLNDCTHSLAGQTVELPEIE